MNSKLKFRPHINVLRFIDSLGFGCGKSLVSDVLTGNRTSQVRRLKLHKKILFGSLALYQKEDVIELIDSLLSRKFLTYERPNGKYYKILALTEKGKEELNNPHDTDEIKNTLLPSYNIEKVNDEDRRIFRNFGESISKLSDEQKKAVIHTNPRILCIAGAGTGKTRVLTSRVWFLIKFRNIPQEKVLAITFTRKARREMIARLDKQIPGNLISIETFNSFCEKILKKNEDLV